MVILELELALPPAEIGPDFSSTPVDREFIAQALHVAIAEILDPARHTSRIVRRGDEEIGYWRLGVGLGG